MSDPLLEMIQRVSENYEIRISDDDIIRWAGTLNNSNFYDAVGLKIASEYQEGRLSYTMCDTLVNELWSCVLRGFTGFKKNQVPPVFYDVFVAFDAGEYHRVPDKSDNPVAEHTDKLIHELLVRHIY